MVFNNYIFAIKLVYGSLKHENPEKAMWSYFSDRFGESDEFICNCLDPLELCGNVGVEGSCSACPPGWKGPGCNVRKLKYHNLIILVKTILST